MTANAAKRAKQSTRLVGKRMQINLKQLVHPSNAGMIVDYKLSIQRDLTFNPFRDPPLHNACSMTLVKGLLNL